MTVRVVTLPRGADAVAFATRARAVRADALEVRDDLTGRFDAEACARVLPLLLAHRSGSGFDGTAVHLAQWEDRPLGGEAAIVSHHASQPLTPGDAEALWAGVRAPYIKHVEPLGDLKSADRLLETQDRLIRRYGEGRVTVLATGDCALPWRAVLAQRNAFDYLALDAETSSAPGQRLLADAVRADVAPFSPTRRRQTEPAAVPLPAREDVARPLCPIVAGNREGLNTPSGRLGILGSGIAHARSPRIHPQPIDRVDLPTEADVRALVEALRPHYRGFAITAPFKRRFEEGRAINTLVRAKHGWRAFNTDVDGARAVLSRFHVSAFTALGDGGVTWALRKAAGARMGVMKAAEAGRQRGDVVWTWPEQLPAPRGLRLDGCRVLLVCYGAAAVRLARRVRELGGTPVHAGPCWFIAQARAQRRLWQEHDT